MYELLKVYIVDNDLKLYETNNYYTRDYEYLEIKNSIKNYGFYIDFTLFDYSETPYLHESDVKLTKIFTDNTNENFIDMKDKILKYRNEGLL